VVGCDTRSHKRQRCHIANIWGKKEREGTVKTIYVKIDYRIVATKFRKSKLKCDILMWNAENSAI